LRVVIVVLARPVVSAIPIVVISKTKATFFILVYNDDRSGILRPGNSICPAFFSRFASYLVAAVPSSALPSSSAVSSSAVSSSPVSPSAVV